MQTFSRHFFQQPRPFFYLMVQAITSPELHMFFQGFVESTEEARRARTGDKREEGDNGNEFRARAGGDGKEKEINSIHSFRYRYICPRCGTVRYCQYCHSLLLSVNSILETIPINCPEAHVPTPRYGQYLSLAVP